jgi:hypothetical protein
MVRIGVAGSVRKSLGERRALPRPPWIVIAVMALVLAAAECVGAQPDVRGRVRLWDTVTPVRGQASVAERKAWQAITPAAPGHLQGDLVVETDGLVAAFASRLGKVLVYGTAGPAGGGQAAVCPSQLLGKQAAIASTTMAEQAGVVMVEADFREPGRGGVDLPVTFWFTGTRTVAIRPEGATKGVSVSAPMDLAVLPSIVGDDLIYDPRDYPSAKTLSLPSEHFLLGLLKGEGSVLVMTWQGLPEASSGSPREAMPSVRLELGGAGPEQSGIEAVTFVGGNDICLAMLDAPGIWHREHLDPSFLERDVALQWRPPFPAMWLTQLYEDEVKTTFEFRHEKEEHWRGGIGSYTFPTWFSDGKAMLSLSKQLSGAGAARPAAPSAAEIGPEGEAIIYFLERSDDTPEQVESPIDIARRTLAGDARVGVLDVEGRPTWWPMRPDAVIGGETCNVTDDLKKIFEAGQEVAKQIIVRAGVEDMYFHLEVMFERDGRYYPFAKDMIAYLDTQAEAKPELAPYLRELRAIPEQMIATYGQARDTMGSMDYAHELGAKTIALAAEKRPDNPQRFEELKQGWCGMGGTLEELSRRENTFARKLHQQAAYRAAENPEAVAVAEEIRKRTKQCLRRPDSYEIWENW